MNNKTLLFAALIASLTGCGAGFQVYPVTHTNDHSGYDAGELRHLLKGPQGAYSPSEPTVTGSGNGTTLEQSAWRRDPDRRF